ncbi:MAG: histidine--tRNA ligase [Acidimicrobiales bacterium]
MSDPVAPFQAPVGTHDVLGPASAQWEGLAAVFAQLAYRYGFSLVMTPIFEDVGVFVRGIGEESDVFRNEMYTFEDRGGRRYALRPEGTASVVRAFVQHNPTTPWKAWYLTPAFRYEKPQKGRYRQHYQFGVEALGTDDPAIDVEVITLAHNFYRDIGLRQVTLLINSMGHRECRAAYVVLLSEYLAEHESELCDEHQKGWRENPLRVLDCKREACVQVTSKGPMLIDHICEECRSHFDAVVGGLSAIGITSTLDPRLVRGFDYYNRTTFEFVAEAFKSAQNSIGGGGRYDQLAEELGGKPTSGIGFGSGVERLILAREAEGVNHDLLKRTLDVFVIDTTGDESVAVMIENLRAEGFAVDRAYDQRSMKAQMKAADRSGARFALLVGPEELSVGEVTIRDLRSQEFDQTQQRVGQGAVVAAIAELLTK